MTYSLTWLFTNPVSTPTITIGLIMLNLIFFFVELTIQGTVRPCVRVRTEADTCLICRLLAPI